MDGAEDLARVVGTAPACAALTVSRASVNSAARSASNSRSKARPMASSPSRSTVSASSP
jgi:hypothetical protein